MLRLTPFRTTTCIAGEVTGATTRSRAAPSRVVVRVSSARLVTTATGTARLGADLLAEGHRMRFRTCGRDAAPSRGGRFRPRLDRRASASTRSGSSARHAVADEAPAAADGRAGARRRSGAARRPERGRVGRGRRDRGAGRHEAPRATAVTGGVATINLSSEFASSARRPGSDAPCAADVDATQFPNVDRVALEIADRLYVEPGRRAAAAPMTAATASPACCRRSSSRPRRSARPSRAACGSAATPTCSRPACTSACSTTTAPPSRTQTPPPAAAPAAVAGTRSWCRSRSAATSGNDRRHG